MEKLTITEALSEIKLIDKKITKKRETITGNVSRPKHMPDPFEKEGGGASMNARELQAIFDLQARHVKIRSAISAENQKATVKIDNKEMTVADWLIYRRDVMPQRKQFYTTLYQTVKQDIDRAARQPAVYKDEKGEPKLVETQFNLDLAEIIREQERIQNIEEKLDGALSLKNATTVIDV